MDLNVGQGRCQGTARLLLKPVRDVIELGAAPDVLSAAIRAVHHANRKGLQDDFIAIAFPTMRQGRVAMLPGYEIELVGSHKSLAAFLELEGIVKLARRGMLEPTEIGEVFVEVGATAAGYLRDRSSEKHTAGWIRRSKARAERRGKPLGKHVLAKRHDPKILTIKNDDVVLHIREVIGVYSGTPLMVSTYGLSSVSVPAILPVFADSACETGDAA